MSERPEVETLLVPELPGMRLDQYLGQEFDQYSRSRWQKWIKSGLVQLNGETVDNKTKLYGGESLQIHWQSLESSQQETPWTAQKIELDIVFEDEDILVINKPAGLVVHPGAGQQDGTMVNALLHHAPSLQQVPRAGVIHRLDKETSGVLVVAKTLSAHHHLVDQLQERAFEREYRAVVVGVMTAGGQVDEPIGRHPKHRTRMAVVSNGKPAITHYRVLQRYSAHTLVKVKLETGRTHQIRVHMAHIRYPLVGDPDYGGRLKIPAGASEELQQTLRQFKRQALHAYSLGLTHPRSKEWVSWTVPIPADMQNLIDLLERHEQQQ